MCVSESERGGDRQKQRDTETDGQREERKMRCGTVSPHAWGWQAAGTTNITSAFPWAEGQSRLPDFAYSVLILNAKSFNNCFLSLCLSLLPNKRCLSLFSFLPRSAP